VRDRPGRQPPRPTQHQIGRTGAGGSRKEGYSGGASPSMDVSNTAGAGGASSYRGHGSVNEERSRYLHPDDGYDIPR
jgi:hypothetical protein